MNEVERRKVNVWSKLHGTKFTIVHEKVNDGFIFVLYDENSSRVASSLSDSALSTWAFNNGAFEVRSAYDLAVGDMSK